MKNILLIDDLRDFRDPPVGVNLVIVRNSADAIRTLDEMSDLDWDEIWFDHDLGLLNNGEPDTTMSVVDYIGERSFNLRPVSIGTVFIHTSNPPGRDNIRRAMTSRGYHCIVVQPEQVFIVNYKNEQ